MHKTATVLRVEDGDAAQDDELIKAARRDAAAFGLLYHRYVNRVYAYLRARTDTADDAGDLTQQVFLQALAALPRYRGQGSAFPSWLFRIARNSVSNFHSRYHSTVTWDLIPAALHPVAAHDLEAEVLHREALDRLSTVLRALDTDTREILALRFAARLTAVEIATVIGKSEAATKKRLSRALEALKERYYDSTR